MSDSDGSTWENDMTLIRFCIASVLVLIGTGVADSQSRFAVDFTWAGTTACFDPKSPPFSLSGVPAGTKTLTFAMQDLDAPNFPHGGGSVPYRGQSRIERGAFTYKGPCPPQGQHRYQWTVAAQDGAGRVLARTTAMKKFPPE
jgi:phosphatidylethanolamine-binding protein (PEBP) family uncharacterized protein